MLYLLLACADDTAAPSPSTSSPSKGPTVTLNVDYGSEKKDWMSQMEKSFEASHPKLPTGEEIVIESYAAGSGDIMQDILSGKRQPDVFSPASSAYITLLNEQWLNQAGHTAPLASAGEPLVLSPVVIAMWKPMAEALGWPGKAISWADLIKINANPKGWSAFNHPEWGLFKLGHTHPGLSNSGLLSVLAEAYAGAGKTRGLTVDDLKNPAVEKFMSDVESSLVHYGKSTSFFSDKMIERGPSYVSAAVLYENVVISSYTHDPAPQFPIVSLYPVEGTFWSDHPYSVVDAPYVDQKKKDAAKVFLDYLKSRPSQEAALALGFRPGDPAVAIAAPIDAAHGADPLQPQTLLEVPDGRTLAESLNLWERTKKTSDVILVFDKSGSMRGDPLKQAQMGAISFLKAMGDRDSVSLQFFDSTVLDATPVALLGGGGREQLSTIIQNSIASGGTALYDAVDAAYKEASQRAEKEPKRIHAVVVMTDGNDENSTLQLQQLTQHFQSGEEGSVRVFTIAYGSGADPKVLSQIAEQAGGATMTGDSKNIDALFRDMAAFF